MPPDEPDFKWGNKRGKGGKKKDVQFYDSFTYDDVDYALYDVVYLHVDDQPVPYIGKLVKIWENGDSSKRVKVQWFFLPFEISHHLEGVEMLENEVFFASGVGEGLAHINPLIHSPIMPPDNAVVTTDEPDFKWGKSVKTFYDSFTYDGVNYSLYDVVYLHVDDHRRPYIAKLLEIWENGDASKQIKVQWFFLPIEISNHLEGVETLENEVLFASGVGDGLVHINPLESIGGKCNVVCISKDGRNPQPPDEAVQTADFVFYRTFDVGLCKICDQFDDKVGGLEVKFVFNRKEDFDRLVSDSKAGEISGSILKETLNLQGLKIVIQEESSSVKHVQESQETNTENKLMEKESELSKKHSGVKDNIQDIKLLENQAVVEDKVNDANKSSSSDDVHPTRAADKVASSEVRPANGATSHDKDYATHVATSVLSKANAKTDGKSTCGLKRDSKLYKNPSKLDESLSKRSAPLVNGTPNEKAKSSTSNTSLKDKHYGAKSDFRGPVQSPNMETTSGGLTKRRLKKSTLFSNEKRKQNEIKSDDFGHGIKDSVLVDGSCHVEGGHSKKARFEDCTRKPNVGDNIDRTTIKELEMTGSASKESLAKKAKFVDPLRKSKVVDNDASTLRKKSKEDISASQTKGLPTLSTSSLDKAKLRNDNGPSKERHNDKTVKVSNNELSKASITTSKSKDKKVQGQKFEVLPRPLSEHHDDKEVKISNNDDLPKASITTSKIKDKNVEGQKFEVLPKPRIGKSNWIKLPWKEKAKAAHDQGRLVLLMNLVPDYTSVEVEDIVWAAFDMHCTAKVLPHTATSDRNSGQALVVFNTREAADRVLKELDEGCLMLPNHRPLVACVGVLPKSGKLMAGKQKTFFGHLPIIKTRRQKRREWKDAVSSAHYAQTNTLEYDMAMLWRLLQARFDKCWEKLYEKQNGALKKLMAGLKLK